MRKKLYKNLTGEGRDVEEAIAAVATGQGRTAIGIIRLTGEGCIDCAARVFAPSSGRAFASCEPGKLTLGTLRDGEGKPLDQAMAVLFKAPHSYTGEDACELHCHGSPTVLTLALDALSAQGVRQASPGEFTKRAFLNGKLDLTRAEAVADLIDAQTPAAVRQAAGQLSGGLQRRVERAYDGLTDLLAHFHAAVDYPDEDLAPFAPEEIDRALDRAGEELSDLLDTYRRGRLVREGVAAAIVGRPNVGKSTLLNALVGFDRSIVTDCPGTTRDTVEERCVLGGVLVRLVDTAGLRQAADQVERLGVERSRRAMEEAGLIFVVAPAGGELSPEDRTLLEEARALAPTVLVRAKADLALDAPTPGAGEVAVSAKTDPRGTAQALGRAVEALFPAGAEATGELLTNARQADCARQALEALGRAREAHRAGTPPDLVLLDVEEAMTALGALTGRNLQQDVVARIFERFCVGK